MKGRLALPAWLILLWMLQACLSYWTVPGVTKEEAMLVAMEKWRTKVTELDDGTISGSSNQISSTRWAMASCFCGKVRVGLRSCSYKVCSDIAQAVTIDCYHHVRLRT